MGHAGFRIVNKDGMVVYIDPFEIPKDEKLKADIVISSHGHYDHFDLSSIENLRKEDTKVIGPIGLMSNLKKIDGIVLNFGESYDYKGFKIELIPGYTANKNTHPKNAGGAGILLETENMIVYHAGDSDRIPEMKDLASRNIKVALLPCGGTYTMDMDMATDCALDIKPEIVVPMHNWNKNLNEFKTLMKSKDPTIQVEILLEKKLSI